MCPQTQTATDGVVPNEWVWQGITITKNNLAIVSRFHLEQSLPKNILLEEEIDIEVARSNRYGGLINKINTVLKGQR